MKKMKIGYKLVGDGESSFIIAEAGVNHNGDLELAKKLIDVAIEAGADAIKFQTFKAENLVTKDAGICSYQEKNLGGKKSQLEMLKEFALDYADFKKLKKYCDEKGIIFLSTPHTKDAAEFLKDLVPAFKIGSGDLNNLPFLKKIASYGKPMILGTGMSTLEEVKEALHTIYAEGNREVVMLHCTTNYPCPIREVNLRAMQTMQKELDCLIGYSDHTLGIEIPLIAKKLGAVVIEKHFTLDKDMQGPDHKASLEPDELKKMIGFLKNSANDVESQEIIMGSFQKKPTNSELEIMPTVRKSLVASVDIPSGSKITEKMVVVKRPGTGIPPKEINKIMGKIAEKDIKKDDIIKWSDFKMPKIFVASFNRASDGAISLLLEKMKENNMLVHDYYEADFILAVGDRIETFDFVLKRFQENKRIIHLWAGEISQGTHDEVYRHAMTMMSEVQLCTNPEAKQRVIELCKAVGKEANAYVMGNIMLDNLEIDNSNVLSEAYDLVLYNPPTCLSKNEILKEIEQIKKLLSKKYIWIEPNGDFGSELVRPYITHSNFSRPEFLGLISNCDRFITNSSCMYYEAPFLLNKEQIISIGKRNTERESKYADMKIKNASDNIIKIFRELK